MMFNKPPRPPRMEDCANCGRPKSSEGRSSALEQLERKLGSVEYELRQHKLETNRQLMAKQHELDETIENLRLCKSNADDWRIRFEQSQKSLDETRQKEITLQRYLEHLPTSETNEQNRLELRHLRSENERLRDRVGRYQEEAGMLNQELNDKGKCLNSSKLREEMLSEELRKCQNELEKFADSNTAIKLQRELNSTLADKQQLQSDLDNAYKVHELLKKRLKMAEDKARNESVINFEKSSREEETIAALRRDLNDKDDMIGNLHMNIKELSSQRESVLKQNVVMENRIHELEALNTKEMSKLITSLLVQMTACSDEIKAIVKFCQQRALRKEPDLSLMLAARSSSPEGTLKENISIKVLEDRLQDIRALRREIDDLKDVICTQYAEEMGDNMVCNQQ
ncbi:DgyrCDS2428 [Dimorphilus gyrociliatus]|nr:DgyrCDS2428 [Dimorphilus gyrociliatus]